jgi:hypothetical protein
MWEEDESMSAFRVFAAVAIAGALAAGSATAADCFLQRNINGFSAPNDRTVYIRVGVKEIWRLDLMTSCTGLTFRNGFALQGSPTGPWICNPLDATVIIRNTGITQRCPVSGIHHLTADEVAALPKKQRP